MSFQGRLCLGASTTFDCLKLKFFLYSFLTIAMFKVFKGLLLCADLLQQYALIYFREFQLLMAFLPILRQNREIIVDFLPNQQTCSYFGP